MSQSSRCCSLLVLRRGRGREAQSPEAPSSPRADQQLPRGRVTGSSAVEPAQMLPGGGSATSPDEASSSCEPGHELRSAQETRSLVEPGASSSLVPSQEPPGERAAMSSDEAPSRSALVPAIPKLTPKQAALLWRCGIAFKDTCCSKSGKTGGDSARCQRRREWADPET